MELGIIKQKNENDFGTQYYDSDARFLVSQGVGALERVMNRLLVTEISRQLMVTAIAIKRYQLKRGTLPTTLAELVPEFKAAIPRDPVDGKPLRYRKTGEATFTLYSIGPDGIDDGGSSESPTPRPPGQRSSLPWTSRRDLVWPTPASPEEVASYEKAQPSKK
jgi:hypothetical protein